MKYGKALFYALLVTLALGVAFPMEAAAQACCPSDGHGSPQVQVASVASATQLGQSWPQVTDQSRSGSWHAYEFALSGIRYVEVTDLGGGVRFAAAVGPNTVLALPIGTDVALVSTPANPVAATLQDVATPIFSADGITVNLVTNAQGYHWQVSGSSN